MASETQGMDTIKLGIKVVSEAFLPGASNLIKGDFKEAGIHAAFGFFARAFFGLPGLVLVSANSLSKAHTGRNLLENLSTVVATSTMSNNEEEVTAEEEKPPKKAYRRQTETAG